jgi:hypothetical protein
MADNRTEIALETIDRIISMLTADNANIHDPALNLLRTFKHAIELTAPPKVGRPRKPKAE